MITKLKIFSIIGLFAISSFAELPSIVSLLVKLDEFTNLKSDLSATVSMTQQKPNQGVKNFGVLYYRRDSDKSFLMIMTDPEAERGNGYLRMGDNFWMYRKNTRTFQHINRDENIAGTDARGDDFEQRPLPDLYDGAKDSTGAELISEEMLGQIAVYKFKIRAKVNDVDYPSKTIWMQKDKFLQLKEECYANSGALMQTAYYLKYTEVEKRFIPVKQIFIDEFEKGNKTIVELSNISMKKVDDALFTKAYLENLSK